jgi:hypothetical protein
MAHIRAWERPRWEEAAVDLAALMFFEEVHVYGERIVPFTEGVDVELGTYLERAIDVLEPMMSNGDEVPSTRDLGTLLAAASAAARQPRPPSPPAATPHLWGSCHCYHCHIAIQKWLRGE